MLAVSCFAVPPPAGSLLPSTRLHDSAFPTRFGQEPDSLAWHFVEADTARDFPTNGTFSSTSSTSSPSCSAHCDGKFPSALIYECTHAGGLSDRTFLFGEAQHLADRLCAVLYVSSP